MDDPSYRIDDADLEEGGKVYLRNCAICHGTQAVSAGIVAPDLRESRLALDGNALSSVVRDGALKQRGMPQFESLTPQQLDKLYAYIRFKARAALAGAPPAIRRTESAGTEGTP